MGQQHVGPRNMCSGCQLLDSNCQCFNLVSAESAVGSNWHMGHSQHCRQLAEPATSMDQEVPRVWLLLPPLLLPHLLLVCR